MAQFPYPRNLQDPRFTNSFLDTCAFDPKCAPEDSAAHEIRRLSHKFELSVLLAHSNQKELEHPNTPDDVKREGRTMIFTLEVQLTPEEDARKAKIHAVLTGNGTPDKYAADAAHVFEASKYAGYFITTDYGILRRREKLRMICSATIVTPSEWLQIYRDTNV